MSAGEGNGKAGGTGLSPYPRADPLPRLAARLFDLCVAALFAWLLPGVGGLAGIFYLLLADGLPNGQSLGKRLLGVKVVHVPTRMSCGSRQSVLRNLPVAVAFALPLLNPFVGVAAIPILLLETYRVFSDPLGHRVGDVFADSQVIDGKVPLATAERDRLSRPRPPLPAEMGEAAEIHS